MYLHPIQEVKRITRPKDYQREITQKYDYFSEIINSSDQPELSISVFAEYHIHTIDELLRYLDQNSEYGGYIRLPGVKKNILIPFHNDFMNTWLKFDNPRIIRFYDYIYAKRKNEYHNRHHFDMERFNIEEEFQLNNWRMPSLDKRMLDAPINGCWDKPELLAKFLTLHGYQVQRMSCNDGNILRGHCFCVYYDGIYWQTASSFCVNLKHRNYHTFCAILLKIMKHVPIFSDSSKCRLMEFDAPRPNCTGREYLDLISSGKIVAD